HPSSGRSPRELHPPAPATRPRRRDHRGCRPCAARGRRGPPSSCATAAGRRGRGRWSAARRAPCARGPTAPGRARSWDLPSPVPLAGVATAPRV
ncbi:MAG: hypothetical protein AVDCRST_MAG29-801, partial [uncultured Nocardioidaceae bacterium]